MLAIDGALQVVPHAFASDTGELRVDGNTKPAVIQSYQTQSGVVNIVLPAEEIDRVIEALQRAQQDLKNKDSDLYIPPSADAAMKQAEEFQKVQDEIKLSK